MKKRTIIITTLLFLIDLTKAQTVSIIDFGAVPDGLTVNTACIQMAIDSVSTHGGGTVYVPSGVFITGTFELKSNINLFLETGAEIKGSSDINDYKVFKAANFDRTHYGIIYSYQANNISITGQGTINGNEEVFFDWNSAKKIEWSGTQNTR
ncbi:MAG: hypothetical protein H6Q21_2359, partial [Bacteroidetes bacterium]|nr:hypothetical protein [Bacteroidota bacterium]